jgi:hypothetical protein
MGRPPSTIGGRDRRRSNTDVMRRDACANGWLVDAAVRGNLLHELSRKKGSDVRVRLDAQARSHGSMTWSGIRLRCAVAIRTALFPGDRILVLARRRAARGHYLLGPRGRWPVGSPRLDGLLVKQLGFQPWSFRLEQDHPDPARGRFLGPQAITGSALQHRRECRQEQHSEVVWPARRRAPHDLRRSEL